MVEKSNRILYKLEILFLKIIPMIIAFCDLLNVILSYFYIETEVLTYIAGIGLLPLLFIYLSSFAFKFCIYHRMFIYYILVNNVLCFIDDKCGIPISNIEFVLLHIILAGISLFLILFLKFKIWKKN